MHETWILTGEEQRVIEDVGLHFAKLGVSLIGGRVFGLLLIAPRPLMLDEIARLLHVSRASVSTNTRMFIHIGLLEPCSVRGDRRRYYVMARNAWEHRLRVGRVHAGELRRLIGVASRAVAAENTAANERLRVAGAFAEFLEGTSDDLLARWQALHGQLEGAS